MSNQNQDRSKLVDVSHLGLACKTCTKAITQLPFTPKSDKPLDCMECHSKSSPSDGRRTENRGGGRHHDRSRGSSQHAFTKGEQIEVIFVQKDFGSGSRVVSYLTDGTIVFPKTLRFRPIPGKKYQCSVMIRDNDRGPFGLALPTLPMTLTPKEWVPVEELRSCLVANLTFQQKPGREGQDRRLIAFHEGRAVFPDNGTTVVPGRPVACLLREAGNVAFAIPLGIEQSTGTGLVRLGELVGEVNLTDLMHVVVKAASKKAGVVGMPKADADLDVSGEYRNIYELLSDPEAKVLVNESSSEDEVNKAYRRKTLLLHPDRVAQDFGGQDKVPLPIKKNAEFFFEALGTAKDRALDLIARKKAKNEKRDPKAATATDAGNASAQKADKPKRDRKPRHEGAKQQKPVEAAPAQPVETKPVEGAVEAGEAEAPVQVEAPVAQTEPEAEAAPQTEAKSETEGATDEVDPMVKGLSEELKEPVAVVLEALALSKKTAEEFAGLGENIHKFYLKQARGRVRLAKEKAAVGNGGSKKAEAKGGSAKGDFRAQLGALKADK
ncbi:MAG: hypothetical protein RL272_1296 [Candidatus Parcubacteria bacterium]|jgi:hypothetical protein